jgi:PPOX class probable FMN-dependent enzyme
VPACDRDVLDEAALVAAIGEPMEFVRAKICTSLNEAMREFIQRSPLILVSTLDEDGFPDVSPKGDPPGFVQIDEAGDLLIPERPGNRLAFGFRNILRDSRIGLIFIAPGQRETLRVKGTATLHRDPDQLPKMQVSGKPALLYTRVRIAECFFHCGKALIRSHLWNPAQWEAGARSIAARQFTAQPPADEETLRQTEAMLEQAYRDQLY